MSQKYLPGQPQQLPRHNNKLALYKAEHVLFEVKDGVATLTLNRPERKNPLSFESYAEMRDLFRAIRPSGGGSRRGYPTCCGRSATTSPCWCDQGGST